jgi:type IV secretion system protein VirB10
VTVSAHPPGSDPRRALRQPVAEADVRPVVARPPRSLPWWIIAGGVAIAALLLFGVLDARRRALTAPTTKVRSDDNYDRAAAPPPTLFVPPVPRVVPTVILESPRPLPSPAPRPQQPLLYPPVPMQPPVTYTPPVQVPQPPQAPQPAERGNASAPALVYDGTLGDVAEGAAAPGATGRQEAASLGGERARASTLRNRRTTVPQGTLIPAVLETALDSTRPGLARALVQRDVRGFDGQQVLIARGSRLIGEYRADLQPGQNRASVMWTRLVQPNGVTIALASPAADTLGRGGVRGKVNNHFLERFGAAILQSTLDVGVNLASRLGDNNTSVVVGVPLTQGFGGGQSLIGGNQVQRTLTVRQGTALMVFVARDLDFTGVAGR